VYLTETTSMPTKKTARSRESSARAGFPFVPVRVGLASRDLISAGAFAGAAA
jgi:hypothetical protein